MATRIDRAECIRIIQQWFSGKRDPLIAFPDSTGFGNVLYLYDNDAAEMIDEVAQLMGHMSVKLKHPVVLFIEHTNRAPKRAYTCNKWLKLINE